MGRRTKFLDGERQPLPLEREHKTDFGELENVRNSLKFSSENVENSVNTAFPNFGEIPQFNREKVEKPIENELNSLFSKDEDGETFISGEIEMSVQRGKTRDWAWYVKQVQTELSRIKSRGEKYAGTFQTNTTIQFAALDRFLLNGDCPPNAATFLQSLKLRVQSALEGLKNA